MIQGHRDIPELDALHLSQHRILFQNCLGLIEKVATTVPTTDTLPVGYMQFANISGERRFYINLGGVVYDIISSIVDSSIANNVIAPATNTADKIPQWNGANSKTLKDGLTVGTVANNLVQLDSNAKLPAVDGSQLTGIAPDFPNTAGDILIFSADTLRTTTNTNYVKCKEIYIGQTGTLRIKFTLDNTNAGGGNVYGRIYKNGVAVGTERSQTSIVATEYSEDIVGWVRGDLCQIYHKQDASAESGITNFRIYTDSPVAGGVVTD